MIDPKKAQKLVLEEAIKFENSWTQKGLPADVEGIAQRSALGQSLHLLSIKVSEEVLLGYARALLKKAAEIQEKLKALA